MSTIHRPDIPPILAKYDFAVECHSMQPDRVQDERDMGYCEYLLACKMSVMKGWLPKP